MTGQLKTHADSYGIALDGKMLGDFEKYLGLLLEWNSVMNLTAITEPVEIIQKHFLDSLLVLKAWDIPEGASVIDVGSGAGFPGVPLKIARPDIRLTLLDGLGKRLRFLEEVSQKLGQSNDMVHIRAEDAARSPEYRERFDVVTARAVAELPVLCEYCLPFVRPGGVFLALKGPDAETEIAASRSAIPALGGELGDVRPFELPNGDKRRIAAVLKKSETPSRFPRRQAKITQSPL